MIDRRAFLAASAGLAATLALPRPLFARQADGYPPPDLEKMVPVEGGRVYVRVNGNLRGRKPPIVMLHGGPGGTHAHFLTALALADERAVILYDQLDSGQSDRPNDPKNWRVSRFVDEADLVRQALGVERWHLLGHSWGGTLALEYGARRPKALLGLALVSPLVSTRSWIADANLLRTSLPAGIQAEIARCDAGPSPICDDGTNAFYRAFNGREPATIAATIYARSHPGGFNPKLYNAMWGASEFVSTGSLRDYDGEPLLARLDGRRTIFVGGQYDEARPATLAGFAARVPGAEFATIPGAAHGLFADRPRETVATIRAWLARQDALD
ncbi:proline iminopeptidase-family hydrolase [Sphingomonas sp.]|uniref:proline iminopeptidase-family hydrolase n=1 Tax=Sphingomonas sp. TaxID=28214 RepID=UPI002E3458F4|nr:proline iminopeptidase-family hydrolase [Sphingomonas sp.]HEX4694815.1 proline iminopeptidase-family hydrolase [Sphingomonas sp.]